MEMTARPMVVATRYPRDPSDENGVKGGAARVQRWVVEAQVQRRSCREPVPPSRLLRRSASCLSLTLGQIWDACSGRVMPFRIPERGHTGVTDAASTSHSFPPPLSWRDTSPVSPHLSRLERVPRRCREWRTTIERTTRQAEGRRWEWQNHPDTRQGFPASCPARG
jgi:hypothetical protein